MPNFIKLKINAPIPKSYSIIEPEYSKFCWKLILKTSEDFIEWAEWDSTANANAFLSLCEKDRDVNRNFTHLGGLSGREEGLARVLSISEDSPIVAAGKMCNLKHIAILKSINNGHEIAIDENGCAWSILDSFIKIWDCEIIESVKKEGFGFPVSDLPEKSGVLILENAPYSPYRKRHLSEVAETFFEQKNINIIFSLPEKDERYVFKAISLCENLFIESEFLNGKQIELFGKALLAIEKKTICLSSTRDGIVRVKKHPLFDPLNNKHNILFL